MNHSEAQARMMERLDGVITPAGQAGLDAHLSECVDCRRLWEGMRQVDVLLAAAPARPAPANFSRRMAARLDDPLLREQWTMIPAGRGDWVRALAAAVTLAMGCLALAIWVVAPTLLALGQLLPGTLPAQLPLLIAQFADWYLVIAAIGRGLFTLLNGLNQLLAMNPVVYLIAFALLAVVALWAWMLQQLAPGAKAPGGHMAVWL